MSKDYDGRLLTLRPSWSLKVETIKMMKKLVSGLDIKCWRQMFWYQRLMDICRKSLHRIFLSRETSFTKVCSVFFLRQVSGYIVVWIFLKDYIYIRNCIERRLRLNADFKFTRGYKVYNFTGTLLYWFLVNLQELMSTPVGKTCNRFI